MENWLKVIEALLQNGLRTTALFSETKRKAAMTSRVHLFKSTNNRRLIWILKSQILAVKLDNHDYPIENSNPSATARVAE
ncbi:MAG: hypothetical protein CTY19_14185 [Methylomonas sp.]|nr:MAG: hypothetical protein CTY19_14185 [Methylomonas sp.]